MWGLDSFREPGGREYTRFRKPEARFFVGGGICGGWFAGGKSYLRLAPALLGLKA